MSKIVVVGSSNTDMVVKTARFPSPGETIIGGDFFMFPGGKGANQAVAAARLGGDISFISSVGDDLFGQNALKGYQADGINTDDSKICEGIPSGVALITVNAEGENEIVVASGANALLSPDYLRKLESISKADIILTQLETPIESVAFLSTLGKKLIINPAPAQKLDDEILRNLFLITPNETETALLTGIEVNSETDALKAAQVFLQKGVQNVVITMGAKGAFFMNEQESFTVPSQKVKAVDTTAAGDVFNGALTVQIAAGKDWKNAITFANAAAAKSVTKMGAQASAPYLDEINLY